MNRFNNNFWFKLLDEVFYFVMGIILMLSYWASQVKGLFENDRD
jgi:hypothetical protein